MRAIERAMEERLSSDRASDEGTILSTPAGRADRAGRAEKWIFHFARKAPVDGVYGKFGRNFTENSIWLCSRAPILKELRPEIKKTKAPAKGSGREFPLF